MNKRLLVAFAALAVMLCAPSKGEGGSTVGVSGGGVLSHFSATADSVRLEIPAPRGHYAAQPFVRR